MSGLNATDRAFLEGMAVARLATADRRGAPHVVPICFVVLDDTLYFTIDEKPKSGDTKALKRLRNIAENDQVAVVVDRYEEDWSRLGWVMVRGRGEVIEGGLEHQRAQEALVRRYRQYEAMRLDGLPVVAIRIERVARWGNLEVEPSNDGQNSGQQG